MNIQNISILFQRVQASITYQTLIVEGLISCIADATVNHIEDNSILSEIDFPQAKLEKSFLKWILKHNLSENLANCLIAHIPLAIAVLEKYQQAWGEKFLPIFFKIGAFPFLATALGMGVGIWDDLEPEDFGIEKSNQHPEVGLHELNFNAIYDLANAMTANH